jgi:hypothetical protein
MQMADLAAGNPFQWQPLATVAASFFVLAVGVLNVREGFGLLRRVERLSSLGASMQPSAKKAFVEEYRDEILTAWTLRRLAPRLDGLRVLSITTWVAGILALLLWGLLTVAHQTTTVLISLYVAGFILISSGNVFRWIRLSNRTRWMRQEREWRGIPAAPNDPKAPTRGDSSARRS